MTTFLLKLYCWDMGALFSTLALVMLADPLCVEENVTSYIPDKLAYTYMYIVCALVILLVLCVYLHNDGQFRGDGDVHSVDIRLSWNVVGTNGVFRFLLAKYREPREVVDANVAHSRL